MDSFLLILRRCILLFFVCYFAPASASISPLCIQSGGACYGDISAAYSAYMASKSLSGYTLSCQTTTKTSTTWGYSCYNNAGSGYPVVFNYATSCPSNSTLSGSQCVCNAGFTQVGSGCRNTCPSSGSGWSAPSASGAWKTSRVGATNFCPDNNCVVTGSSFWSSGGFSYIGGPWRYTGGYCSSSDLSGNGDGNTPCAVGYGTASMNGVTVCVKQNVPVTSVQSSSQAASSVSTSASGVQTTTTSSGSQTSSTTCNGGTCTTTTTTASVNPDGSSTSSTGTSTQSQDSFCKSNPGDPQCKTGSFGGTCSSGFTCDGDAVACAIAQADWKNTCNMDASQATQAQSDFNTASSGDFKMGDPRSGSGQALASSFDTTERYSGSCPQDPVFSVWGKSVTVPISQGCTWLGYLGNAAVAVCLLAGARIALGGAN